MSMADFYNSITHQAESQADGYWQQLASLCVATVEQVVVPENTRSWVVWQSTSTD